MFKRVADYFATLTDTCAAAWNRFWFQPSGSRHLCLLRLLVGILGLVWMLSFSPDLVRWFGPRGLLPPEAVRRVLTGGDDTMTVYAFSYLWGIRSAGILWTAHLLGMVVLLLFTLGLVTRVTGPLSLVAALSYVHRAPMLTGPFEPVLCMLLAYLSLAPAGDHFSVRRFLPQRPDPSLSVMANISTRLIQVHLSALYLMTGLSKLGSEVWWNGEAGWWLIAQTQTRLVDLSYLRDQTFAINALTHGLVLFDLLYGVFIWHRLARPLLIGSSVFVWTITAMLTGLVGFACIMMAANLAFVTSESAEAWGGEGGRRSVAEV